MKNPGLTWYGAITATMRWRISQFHAHQEPEIKGSATTCSPERPRCFMWRRRMLTKQENLEFFSDLKISFRRTRPTVFRNGDMISVLSTAGCGEMMIQISPDIARDLRYGHALRCRVILSKPWISAIRWIYILSMAQSLLRGVPKIRTRRMKRCAVHQGMGSRSGIIYTLKRKTTESWPMCWWPMASRPWLIMPGSTASQTAGSVSEARRCR